MSIPLVQNNEKDSINTSIIAIKRNIEHINMLLGLVDSGSPDLSGLATKQELEDAVNSLQPVDEVAIDNMQSVTSNAVAVSLNKLNYTTSEVNTGLKWIDGKPIYRKVVAFGALPNSTYKSINHNISNIDFILKVEGVTTDGTYYFEIPRAGIPNAYMVDLYTTKTKITIETSIDCSAYTTTYVILEYTKTTD